MKKSKIVTTSKIVTLLLATVALLSLTPVTATAQTTYSMPLVLLDWPSNTVTVRVQSSPTWAYNAVVSAMSTWNQAQTWFTNTYYPTAYLLDGSAVITFTLTPGQGEDNASITFTNQPVTCGSVATAGACTSWYETSTVTVIDIQWGQGYTTYLAVHELGRVMGLGTSPYTSQLNGNPDVMSEDNGQSSNTIPAISTLDLYGLMLRAEQSSYQTATLPPDIPYVESPAQALPELSTAPIAICLTTTAAALLLTLKRKGRNLTRRTSPTFNHHSVKPPKHQRCS